MAKKETKKVVDVCKKCGSEPCTCVKEEAKPELKESGKPVIKDTKELKPKTMMKMIGGRMREIEVE